jgi:UDP-N-acetylmuramoyl-tripeptide--D-alanyl-D-alanine ligase
MNVRDTITTPLPVDTVHAEKALPCFVLKPDTVRISEAEKADTLTLYYQEQFVSADSTCLTTYHSEREFASGIEGELYDFLRQKENSIVFIQNENPFLMDIAEGLNLINYGTTENLYVNGKVTSCSPYLAFDWKAGKDGNIHHIQTKLIGEYNFDNALAAVAIGRFFGVEPAKIDHALTNYTPQNNRSQLKETEDNKLIIDAYNANPTSMMAALKNFKRMEAKHKVVILGDMKELGDTSIEEHQKIVDFIDTCEFEKVILVGDQFEQTTHSYDCFTNISDVVKVIKDDKPKGCYILIKGSNSMKMGQIVEDL